MTASPVLWRRRTTAPLAASHTTTSHWRIGRVASDWPAVAARDPSADSVTNRIDSSWPIRLVFC